MRAAGIGGRQIQVWKGAAARSPYLEITAGSWRSPGRFQRFVFSWSYGPVPGHAGVSGLRTDARRPGEHPLEFIGTETNTYLSQKKGTKEREYTNTNDTKKTLNLSLRSKSLVAVVYKQL